MTKYRKKTYRALQATLLVCFAGALSSCGGNSNVTEDAPSLPVSEASLLSDSEKSDSQTDASIFSDLAAADKKDENAAAATPVDMATDGSGPFYNAIGGESLGRVAYTLYGDRSFRKQLQEKNSGITDTKKLSAGTPVYFDFDNVKPQPTYLTKDLINRYPNELSEKLKSATASGTTTLQAGETLQELSQRLYGTTRYWTEIYLLNHDKISNYDKVTPGMTLTINEHGAVAPAPVAEKAPAVAPYMSSIPPEPAKQPVQEKEPAPVMDTQAAPVAQPTMDPIPDTSEPEAAPVASTVTPVAQPVVTAPSSFLDTIGDSSNANLRRIIYVFLIVAIGGLAFYFTRPSRKQKIDMLDVTAGSTAPPPRSKLGTKDTTRKSIG